MQIPCRKARSSRPPCQGAPFRKIVGLPVAPAPFAFSNDAFSSDFPSGPSMQEATWAVFAASSWLCAAHPFQLPGRLL